MIIKYVFADKTVSMVEVSEEIGSVILKSRREERNGNARERSHRKYILEDTDCQNIAFAGPYTAETRLLLEEEHREREQGQKVRKDKLHAALDTLTEKQRRRLLAHVNGKTIREIAKDEGVQIKAVQDSITYAREKIKEFFQ